MAIDSGLVCAGIVILLAAGLLAYGMLQKRQRKSMIKALKAGGAPSPGGPILIHGPAEGPSLALPSSGEKCAFYAIHVFSKSSTVETKLRSTTIQGFDLLTMTGSFDVRSERDGKLYRIGISEYGQTMMPGVEMVSNLTAAAFRASYGSGPYVDALLDSIEEKTVAAGVLSVVFGMRTYESRSGSGTSVNAMGFGIYSKMKSQIKAAKADVTIDVALHEYTLGKDVPPGIAKLLEEKKITGSQLVKDGDAIYAIEVYIPLKKPVYAAGTYTTEGGKDLIAFKDPVASLSVSYEDPETSRLV